MGDIYERRLTFGLVAMSLAPVVLAALGLFVWRWLQPGASDIYGAEIAVAFLYFFSVAATLVFMPIAFLLRRRNKQSCLVTCSAAATIWSLGALPLLPTLGALTHPGQALLLAALLGTVSGLAYWAVAVRGMSPNSSSKPTPLRGAA